MKQAPLILLGFLLFAAPLRAEVSAQARLSALVDDAMADFESTKYDDSLKKLQEADGISPNSPFILNLMGAAQTKKKDYAGAKVSFEKALDADYDFFPAKFNVGELLFLQKMYPQALEYFSRMLATNPSNELLQFKVVLCLLMTNQTDDARKLADTMVLPGQEPAWYYANAAIAYKKDQRGKTSGFLASAKTLFGKSCQLYSETFSDLGWPTK